MAQIYKHEYLPSSVYGNAVSLLKKYSSRNGVHVDVGCGYGAIAEPIHTELDQTYVGFDLAEDGLESLRARGFEAHRIDLSDLIASEHTIRTALRGRRIASLSLMDTLEHVTNGAAVVAMLRRLAADDQSLLVLSVPNVSHKDLALKLLVGRWDVTETGLLDHTHVEFYTAERMQRLFSAAGWEEIAAKDWLLEQSDQKFPADLPVLHPAAPLGAFLRSLIDLANPHSSVNQFVRAFRPAKPVPASLFNDRDEPSRPLLSIVSTPWGANEDLAMLISDLEQQTRHDFELHIICASGKTGENVERCISISQTLASRTSVDKVSDDPWATLNERLKMVTGRYVVILGPTDRLLPGWVETFASLAEDAPVATLKVGRDGAGPESRQHVPGEEGGILAFAALAANPKFSVAEFAMPGGLFRYQGLQWDPNLEGRSGQLLVLNAILQCGLRSSERPLVRGEVNDTDGEAPLESAQLLQRLNAQPILLPPGSLTFIQHLVHDFKDISQIGPLQWGQIRRALMGQYPRIGAFLEKYIAFSSPTTDTSRGSSTPFLSVITRTQGRRLRTFRDTIMSLAGQSDQEFEFLVIVHSQDEELLRNISAIVDEFPATLRQRARVLACTRPGRAAPLNDGVALARGRYIAVLDDDDFIFGHWVETFRKLAEQAPGAILRTTCTRQDFQLAPATNGSKRPRATSWFKMDWPNQFDAVSHLYSNHTPFMSIAFPSRLFQENGLRFDEKLSTSEDWDLMLRATMLCDVWSSPEVTAVYRWWVDGESSTFAHTPEDWRKDRTRIISRINSGPVLLPAGAAGRIVELVDSQQVLAPERSGLEARYEALMSRALNARLPILWEETNERLIIQAQASVLALINSNSWKFTSPLRRLSALLRGRAHSEICEPPASFIACQQLTMDILSSTSWRSMAPLRFVARVLRRFRVMIQTSRL
jgi:2-polyprenyl-3-methyl-5-hydroxy-6-metoxy-1,4-benzoquinol methylase